MAIDLATYWPAVLAIEVGVYALGRFRGYRAGAADVQKIAHEQFDKLASDVETMTAKVIAKNGNGG